MSRQRLYGKLVVAPASLTGHTSVHSFLGLILVLATLLATGCTTQSSHESAANNVPWPTENWSQSTPEDQGISSSRLAELLEKIERENLGIDSLHIIRNGYLVLDSYRYPFESGARHIIHSCTKSVVSALIGIAIEEGVLKGVNQNVLDVFSNPTVENPGRYKSDLKLKHLLTMTTGLDSRDSYLYRWEGMNSMRRSDDWIVHALGFPAAVEPGKRFDYSNTASFLLSAAIQVSQASSTAGFAREHLFRPLGIEDVIWPENPEGIAYGWGELRLLPLDLAKIGLLYLYNGVWEDEQIVPSKWIRDSTKQHIRAYTLQEFYGYQWWIHPSGTYMALGYAGQYLIVAPDLDLVAVFTSALSEQAFYLPWRLYETYILSAVTSTVPLPDDPAGRERLKAASAALREGPQPVTLQSETDGEIRKTEQSISDRLIILDENPFRLTGMTFRFPAAESGADAGSSSGFATVSEHYQSRTSVYGMGLDGRYEITDDGSLEPVAVRGHWLDSARFLLEYRSAGGAWFTELVLTIGTNEVHVTARTGSRSDIVFNGYFE